MQYINLCNEERFGKRYWFCLLHLPGKLPCGVNANNSFSFPNDFIQQLKRDLPDADILLQTMEGQPLTSIRYNTGKIQPGSSNNPIAWCKEGRYLPQRPVFTLDPLLHAGAYYVQEASSMFLGEVMRQLQLLNHPIHVLDACASPGGKSTQLLSCLHTESLLIANETIKSRQLALVENVVKWGYDNCIVTGNDVSTIGKLTHFFDVIVCDAPCSGEGLFRKDKGSIQHWSTANVELCSLRQQRIVHDVWNSLKPGGFFIYSTCTFNKTENEENIARFLKKLDATCIRLNVSAFDGVVESQQDGAICYRFFPHKIKGEGFTISILKKNEAEISNSKIKNVSRLEMADIKISHMVKDYLNDTNKKLLLKNSNSLFFVPYALEKQLALASSALHIIHAGTALCEIKGNDVIPSHELALSLHINRNKFQVIDVDKETALQVLKGQTQFNFDAENGYCLITYSSIPFAFLKKINNRFNNLFPKNWYIRMAI